MKKTIQTLFSALLVLAFATTAPAHDWRLIADIPFNFNVGDTSMSSGKYTVEIFVNGTLLIKPADRQKQIITLSNAMITPQYLKTGRLVFNLYGNRYFLSNVSWPSGPSRELIPASVELQVAKATQEKRKLEIASQ